MQTAESIISYMRTSQGNSEAKARLVANLEDVAALFDGEAVQSRN